MQTQTTPLPPAQDSGARAVAAGAALGASRRRMLAFGSLPLLLVVAAGAWATGVSLGGTVSFDYASTLPAPSGGVEVDSTGAALQASPSPDGQVHVAARGSWRSARPTVVARAQGNRLVIEARCPAEPFSFCDLQVDVQLPRDAALTVQTGHDPVTISGLGGLMRLTTGSGPIEASELTSPSVIAETGSGPVTLAFDRAPDQVQVTTGSGPVDINTPGSTTYAVTTRAWAVAPVSVDVARDPRSPHRLSLITGSGPILVTATAR